MAKREEVIQTLVEAARNSQSEYVSIRREDLLTALGPPMSKPVEPPPRTRSRYENIP